jgi:hypothetical protein
MQEHGLSLLLSGVLVTLLPPLVAFYFGRYVLRLQPMILFGALAGADRSGVHEPDHRGVRQQYTGARFYRVLRDIQCAPGGLGANHHLPCAG